MESASFLLGLFVGVCSAFTAPVGTIVARPNVYSFWYRHSGWRTVPRHGIERPLPTSAANP